MTDSPSYSCSEDDDGCHGNSDHCSSSSCRASYDSNLTRFTSNTAVSRRSCTCTERSTWGGQRASSTSTSTSDSTCTSTGCSSWWGRRASTGTSDTATSTCSDSRNGCCWFGHVRHSDIKLLINNQHTTNSCRIHKASCYIARCELRSVV